MKVVSMDDRPEAVELLANLKQNLPNLRKLKKACEGHWGFEDAAYRYYHQSWKVYNLQQLTEAIVSALRSLAPKTDNPRFEWTLSTADRRAGKPAGDLHPWFMEIVKEGTGKTFEKSHNERWTRETRPIVEAYCHAKQFLNMAVKYGAKFRDLTAPPSLLDSGWAMLLYLYDLR
jgi:hypothetical protein